MSSRFSYPIKENDFDCNKSIKGYQKWPFQAVNYFEIY